MFVVLTYDIGIRRVKKALKICRKHLIHVQKSVFEGEITEKNLNNLKSSLSKIISSEEDSICIYRTESSKYIIKQEIGTIKDNSHII